MSTSLRISGLVKEYRAGRPVLNGIDLEVAGQGPDRHHRPLGHRQEHAPALHQPADRADRGEITLRSGQDSVDLARVRGAALRRARRRIGMVFQEYNLVERLTVMENLLTGRLGYTSAFKAWTRRFEPRTSSTPTGCWTPWAWRASPTSAPTRCRAASQRVGIARALMQRRSCCWPTSRPRRWIPRPRSRSWSCWRRRGDASGIPVIVNIHDVELARRYATRIVGMSGGSVVYDGDGQGLDAAMLKTIYGGESWLE